MIKENNLIGKGQDLKTCALKRQGLLHSEKDIILNDVACEAMKAAEMDEDVYGPFDSIAELMNALNA